MLRYAVAVAVIALVAMPALAQSPFGMQIVDAKIEKGQLVWTEVATMVVDKEVQVEVEINGQRVIQTRKVPSVEKVSTARVQDVKGVKATDAGGKAIDADKLAEMLKEPTSVVLIPAPLPEAHMKLFKDTTVFLEISQLKLITPPPPGPVPVPPPPPIPQPEPIPPLPR